MSKKPATRPVELVLGQFLEGMNQAAGAAGAMIHCHQDSRWFKVRAVLEFVKKVIVGECVDSMLKSSPPAEKEKVA